MPVTQESWGLKCDCGGEFTPHHGKDIGTTVIACNRCGKQPETVI